MKILIHPQGFFLFYIILCNVIMDNNRPFGFILRILF